MLKWINKRHVDAEDIIDKFKKIDKLLTKANKELELIRISLNLR
jgi:hypothetical protein